MTKLCESIKVFRDASMEYECIPAESMRLIPDGIKPRLLISQIILGLSSLYKIPPYSQGGFNINILR